MHCPFCRHGDTRVLDSRVTDDGCSIRRRRQCGECDRRFTTIEQMQLVVKKKTGVVLLVDLTAVGIFTSLLA